MIVQRARASDSNRVTYFYTFISCDINFAPPFGRLPGYRNGSPALCSTHREVDDANPHEIQSGWGILRVERFN
jgi:hypothetical protein